MALNFPEDANTKRPYVFFQCTARNSQVIALPIPGSLQFSDGATYNNTELGFLGGSLANIASTVSSQGLSGESVKTALANEFLNKKSEYSGASIGTLVQGITAMTGANEGLQSAISIGTGTTVNKNITTEFTSTNTRVFSFQFQLIPRTSSESTKIKNIVKTFREGLYPESIGFQLKYPPKWKIRFPQNSHLPKIGETYLTEVNTTYNGSTNMWRDDGSPLETTIQVSFMETKAYTYDTIPK
jgi:hypothetical protein